MKRKSLIIIILLFLSIILTGNVEAGDKVPSFTILGEIEGYIFDCANNPAPNVQVYLRGISFIARTDDDGHYRLVNVPEGSYQLVVEDPGFFSQSVDVFARETTSIDNIQFCPCFAVFEDNDHDNFGDETSPVNNPPPPEEVLSPESGFACGPPVSPFDCDDTDPSINPSVPDFCCDGVDNNCNGEVDEEGIPAECNDDGNCPGPPCNPSNDPDCFVECQSNPEICDNGVDDNCNGQINEGCS